MLLIHGVGIKGIPGRWKWTVDYFSFRGLAFLKVLRKEVLLLILLLRPITIILLITLDWRVLLLLLILLGICALVLLKLYRGFIRVLELLRIDLLIGIKCLLLFH